MKAQINDSGQITIPADLTQQLGWLPGTILQIEIVDDLLTIKPVATESRGTQLVFSLRGKATNSLSTDEILQLTRSEL